MSITSTKREEIKKDILKKIFLNKNFSVKEFSTKYELSAKTIYSYINSLKNDNLIKEISIQGNKKIYRTLFNRNFYRYLNKDLNEDIIWNEFIKPNLINTNNNCLRIMEYCFTEILNNAIEHSSSKDILLVFGENEIGYEIIIEDFGIGIFEKISKSFKLENKKMAIFELGKGKITTNPKNHTGEGIFFSSRASDRFIIYSDDLFFTSVNEKDVLRMVESHKLKDDDGTVVIMRFLKNTNKNLSKIFEKFTSKDEYGFNKTMVPIKPLEFGYGDTLVSRSQARRLLFGLDKFLDIGLDFKGIKNIEQGFADEIFRVFQNNHPNTKIRYINANKQVENMIKRVKNNII